MVFVSLIHARTLSRRRVLFLIAAFTLISFPCFGQSIFLPVRSTPYDHQMLRVSSTLNSPAHSQSRAPYTLPIRLWMMSLREVPYRYSKYWQTPGEVSVAGTADCKGKAVALYAQMRQSGATNVHVIVGKRHMFDAGTHAWLEWNTTTGAYVLDPTFTDSPIKISAVDPVTYIPFYAYDGEHKYRAMNTTVAAVRHITPAPPATGNRVYPAVATAPRFATTPKPATQSSRHSSARVRHHRTTTVAAIR
ncbi:MAG: hypothetical protein QOG48_855 [Verrucomicrobiota bacterium]|jgi:hypothetical protein